MMDKKLITRKQIMAEVEVMQRHCDLLIEQCDSWLPAEESNRIMEERIRKARGTGKKE
jgi:hypothetical protein